MTAPTGRMSEQREVLAEALLPLYRTAEDDRHDTDGCLCGGECFRESDLRAGAAAWADRMLDSPALAHLLADAEQRGAGRVAAAVGAAIREHGQQHIGGHVWTRDDHLRAALTTGAADRVRAEAWDEGRKACCGIPPRPDDEPNPYRPKGEPTCACGSLTLATTASERHDRGLHGADGCLDPLAAWRQDADQ